MIHRLVLLLGALGLGSAGVVVYIGNADLGRFKSQLTPLVSASIGREVRIDGDLSLHLGRTVTLRAMDVSIANAAWATGPYLVQAAGLEAELDLWSLIRGPVRINSLALQGAVIGLQEADDGGRNWLRPSDDAVKTDDGPARDALPRIAAIKGSDVLVLLSFPNLTEVSEIFIDSVDYAAQGNLITVDIRGEINGHPLQLETEIAPAKHPPTDGAISIDADLRMGDVNLVAGIVLDDVSTLAVSSAELTLSGPDIDHVFRVLKLPEITSGPLSIRASLTPDPQRSGFDADGQLGGYHFAANGWLEDIRGAGGFDLSVRLSGPSLADIGRLFRIQDLPAAPFEVDTRIRSRADGVEFDDTGVVIGEESVRMRGSIARLPNGGRELDLRAAHRGMSATLLAKTPPVWPAGEIDFDFGVVGEDVAEPARYLGLDDLNGQPFALSANGAYGGRKVSLREAGIRVGKQKLGLTGRAELTPDALDIELRLNAESIDLSPWLAGSDLLDGGLRTVAGTGRLKVLQGRLDVDEVALRSGDVWLGGSVSLPLADRGRTGEFALHLKAPAIDSLLTGFVERALSGQPVDLRGDGSWTSGGWQLDELLWRIPERGDVRGSILFAENPSPSISARLSAATLDLRPVGRAPPTPSAAVPGDTFIPAWKVVMPRFPDLDIDLNVEIDSLQSPVTAAASVLLEARLANDRLIVDRLETNGKRGQIRASLTVEADADAAGSLEAQLVLQGQDLYMAAPDEPATILRARPSFDLDATLQAKGSHMRELAETLSGQLLIQAEEGMITRRGGVLVTLVMDDFISRTLETINPLIKERDEVQLNCFVVLAEIKEGKIRGDPLVALQTNEVRLVTRGEVDLGSESLELDIITKPRRGFGISLGDIINPFTRVGGTLSSPRLVADPKSAVLQAGAGILTGGAWFVANKFRDRFFAGNPCAKALEGRNDANQP